MVLSIECTEG